jgi:pimeloyl-ACP methyl ester carboxylesterase
VVGHSMGGCAAQRLLADAPDRVERLVGISPATVLEEFLGS